MPEMKFCPSCAAPLRPKKVEGRIRLCCEADGCEFVFYNNPTPVVAALVEHGGTVLLVRNKEWPELIARHCPTRRTTMHASLM